MKAPDEGESGAAMDLSKLTVTPVARDEEPRFPRAHGRAPLSRRAVEDRPDRLVCGRRRQRRMAGAGRLLGGGAQVRRARRLDRMEPAGAVRTAAPDRQQRAAASSSASAEPRLAVPRALRPAHQRRLAGAPSSSAAAPGDVRGSGPLPRDGLPRRQLDARRRDQGLPPPPRRIRRRIDPEAGPAAAARPQRPEPAPPRPGWRRSTNCMEPRR